MPLDAHSSSRDQMGAYDVILQKKKRRRPEEESDTTLMVQLSGGWGNIEQWYYVAYCPLKTTYAEAGQGQSFDRWAILSSISVKEKNKILARQ